MLAKLLFGVSEQSFSWICDIDPIITLTKSLDLINNYKMILIPVSDAGKWGFIC
ncbi:hypothetical protein IX315_001790 [Porphyromonas levii]|nr:hypothetical protein [Porphyromonas levii]